MAVPKKKTSKARRDKRRAQHGIEAPRVNTCPNCGSPTRPHHVCPTCKQVPRPRHRAAPRPDGVARDPRRGRRAGRGSGARRKSSPARSQRGPTRSSRSCTGRPGSTRAACRSSRRPGEIAMDAKPAEAVRAQARVVARPGRAARSPPTRPMPSSRPGTRVRCWAACAARAAPPARCDPALRSPSPIPTRGQGVSVLLDWRRERRRAPGAPAPVRYMGSVFAAEILGIERAGGSPPLDRRGAREGEPAHARRARAPGRERSQLRRQRREPRPARPRRPCDRLRRLHRQRRPEAARGDDQGAARLVPQARSRRRRPASSAAYSSGRQPAGCGRDSIRTRTAARTCSGCAASS